MERDLDMWTFRFYYSPDSTEIWTKKIKKRMSTTQQRESIIENEDDNLEAHMSADVKICIAKISNELRNEGMKRSKILSILKNAGYEISKSTYHNHMTAISTGRSPLSNNKRTGAAPCLSDEERKISAGYVFSKNSQNLQVNLKDYVSFAKESFDVDLSKATAHNYLHGDGFASRRMATKAAGYKYSSRKLEDMVWEWVTKMKENGMLHTPRSRLCSLDFTYTGHRTEVRKSYAQSGVAQPHSSMELSRFTNLIVTLIWADGVNRSAPILFTYNQEFRTDRNKTTKRQAQEKHFLNMLEEYGIEAERVVYVGRDKGEDRVMVSESPDILRRFFDHVEIPEKTVILSDQGNAFSENGEDVLLQLGFEYHISYPPAVHQYLSPNDNNLHGAAKASWRNSGVDYKDDVNASILLLQHLDVEIVVNSKKWFDRNMINLTKDGTKRLIGGSTLEKSEYYDDCVGAYNNFIGTQSSNTKRVKKY